MSASAEQCFEVNHARHDRAHCLVPGLFRSLQKGERKREKLDITHSFGDVVVRFWGPEPLGAGDLRVLQGLVALAGPVGAILPPAPTSPVGQELRASLEPKWAAVEKRALAVRCSYRALAREIGYAPGDTKAIRDCLERLWAISVLIADQNGRRMGFRILSFYASDDGKGELTVALNPLIARAVLGDGQHVHIDMHEVRSLKSDAARLIHQRLCGWIDPGRSGKVDLDTLCSYAWPTQADNPNTLKTRRQAGKRALKELSDLGWRVAEYATGRFEIQRPKLPKTAR
ncbi:replication protein C, IncQ-type [Tepidimonas charontis]|uniref:Replication protein C (RepC) n=1 Tax=Tepidimonas charontis TaxID=2267262 RepID=A0A554XH33_9BURK|nr:replication protein C, IncQ-type [Tepidimonas charontis]TSE35144.1 Replication protein C (RepC) [Tepidimonas charontis]